MGGGGQGHCSCEVIPYLFAPKLAAPNSVHLLLGNHETANHTAHCGFKAEREKKYGLVFYNRMLRCFEALPVTTVVFATQGNYYACTEALVRKLQLAELDAVPRFTEPGEECCSKL